MQGRKEGTYGVTTNSAARNGSVMHNSGTLRGSLGRPISSKASLRFWKRKSWTFGLGYDDGMEGTYGGIFERFINWVYFPSW